MTYSILDSGNLVVSFDDEADAYAALERIAHESPDTQESLLLIAVDATGEIVDDCVPGERLAHV